MKCHKHVLKSSYLEVFPSFPISLESLILNLFLTLEYIYISMTIDTLHFSSYAVFVFKTNAFLQSYISTSVTPCGLQFKNAFCSYNICHMCKFLNFCFSLLLMKLLPPIEIKCCLLNCMSFSLGPLYLGFGQFMYLYEPYVSPQHHLWGKTVVFVEFCY